MSRTIYLDYAAATPLDKRVLTVMEPYFAERFYNPSATYLAAQAVRQNVQKAREKVAFVLGAKTSEVIFTAGGTEANNLAIKGVMDKFSGSRVITSAIEHESVLEPTKLYDYQLAPVTSDGLVDIEALVGLIDEQTVLISIMYANNEIGTIQPIRLIAQKIDQVRHQRHSSGNSLPLYLHTDAAQAGNYLDLHVAQLGVDLMTLNGGKIYGPKQSGAVFVKSHVKLNPQILGGGQERGLRSGTENVAAIIGFATALELAQKSRSQESKNLHKLQNIFFHLLDEKLPAVVINGSRSHRLPNNIHISFPGQDNERLLMQLDERGIQAAAGSACSAGSDELSYVLKAMGLSQETILGSLRFSMGRDTTQKDVDQVVKILSSLL